MAEMKAARCIGATFQSGTSIRMEKLGARLLKPGLAAANKRSTVHQN
jgi:hypothetical protein